MGLGVVLLVVAGVAALGSIGSTKCPICGKRKTSGYLTCKECKYK